MNPVARALIVFGLLLIVAGVLWQWGGVGKLPGDLAIRRPGFQIYFPFASCLLISALLSLVMWLIRFFGK